MTKKLFLVETVSIFRQRYVVEALEEEHANDEVVHNVSGGYNESWEEFSQKHIDEVITSTREITENEYLDMFDKDNDYLASWPDYQKFRFINRIDYKGDYGSNERDREQGIDTF
jgi:hypothetical protein